MHWASSVRVVVGVSAFLVGAMAAQPGAPVSDEAPIGGVNGGLVLHDRIYARKVVETGSDEATRLVFLDGTHLTLGPRSRVTLDRYAYDPGTGDGAMVLSLHSGVVGLASGLLPSEAYLLRTPLAEITIRGTLFHVLLEDGRMQVAVAEGIVAVTHPSGTTTVHDASSCLTLTTAGPPSLTAIDGCADLAERIVETAILLLHEVEPEAGPEDPPGPAPVGLVDAPIQELPPESRGALTSRMLCELALRGMAVTCPSPN
jgi:hypothetical protein